MPVIQAPRVRHRQRITRSKRVKGSINLHGTAELILYAVRKRIIQ